MLWVMAKGGVNIFVGGGGGVLRGVMALCGGLTLEWGELATMSYVGEMGYIILKFPHKFVNILFTRSLYYSQWNDSLPILKFE